MTDTINSAGCQRPDHAGRNQTQQVKRLVTLTALFAMKGFTFEALDDGTYAVGRWGLNRPFPSIDAVERFLRQIGGSHA